MLVDAPAITGEHPATKPLKFALSLSLLLVSIALILRRTDVSDSVRSVLAWVLMGSLLLEMVAIVAQALRGRRSHFNTATSLDAAIWHAMGAAIVVAMIALVAIAVVATVRPLLVDRASPPLVATGARIGLWLLLLVAVSGVAMGGRGQHTVGAVDGGSGMAVTGWSDTHGDLRVPHFFALHGLQVLPLVALLLARLPLAERGRWIAFAVVALAWCAISVGTLAQALRGRPLVAHHATHDPLHHRYVR